MTRKRQYGPLRDPNMGAMAGGGGGAIRRLTCGHMAEPDETDGSQTPEPSEGIPPLFKIAAVLFFVVAIVLSIVFAPEIAIPDY